MDDFELMIDLHKEATRQGPGGDAETELAMRLAGLSCAEPLRIADIGCGTGAATMRLAERLRARITAVDLSETFLEVLQQRAGVRGVAPQVQSMPCSMDALPFAPESLDVIWSEGAIYNIGFENGISQWRSFLKPGGMLVASEITWLTANPPAEILDHWNSEYPEIDVASAKLEILEQNGYTPVGYFILPERCWLENYYRPMEARFDAFLERHGASEAARSIVDAERNEIELYEHYKSFYSYGFYIARKR